MEKQRIRRKEMSSCQAPALVENGCSRVDNLSLNDLISFLRQAEGQMSVGKYLSAAGLTLIALGFIWGSLQFFRAFPFIVFVLLGVASLLASFVADRNGLLKYLPQGVQDLLMNGTLFDLFHDDVAGINLVRKWGRVQLLALQDGKSEGEVQKIIEVMDPEFLSMVLRRPYLHFLPSTMMRLLLPEVPVADKLKHAISGKAERSQVLDHRSLSSAGGILTDDLRSSFHQSSGSSSSYRASPIAASVLQSAGSREQAPLTAQWIAQFLRAKTKEKLRRILEPEIMPVVLSSMGIETQLKSLASSAIKVFKVCSTAAAGCWILAAGYFFSGSGTGLLVRSLAASGLMNRNPADEQVAKASRIAIAFSLLSAGSTIALIAYSRRVAMFFEDNPSNADSWKLQSFWSSEKDSRSSSSEPEREGSPPDSEASTPRR